jgi:REP element-mobilizing transposase RayT
MARTPRIHVPGAFYHVTLRGNHQQDIFFTAGDRSLFTENMSVAVERLGARLHAYCLMTNHVHLLIQVGDEPLGRLMLRIAGCYARKVQKRLGTTGHLFEKRYHPTLIDADRYLLAVLRYIHLNPVAAKIVTRAADYRWSSHHSYSGTRTEPWVKTDFILAMFDSERGRAVAAYRRFIDSDDSIADQCPLDQRNPHDSRVLGDDQFVARLRSHFWQAPSRKTVDDLIGEACDLFAVRPEALQAPGRERQLAKARAWVAHQAVSLRIATLSDVARRFGRTEGALRQGARRHFNAP